MGGAKASCANPFTSIYDIGVRAVDGTTVMMSEFRGKVLLIVNVASEWGLTKKNYQQLVQIEKEHDFKGLEILGFPCNQFLGQEPGSDEQIQAFAKGYGARFKIFSKVNVNGKKACDLYKFLRLNSPLDGGKIGWNFGKFLVDREGKVVNYFGPRTDPLEIVPHILKLL